MDEVKAREWEERLRGDAIESWTIDSLIDYGKSAAVFKATSPVGPAAVKVFDDELIKRYGDKVQLERINRELSLIGKHHPNMVSLLGGGFHEQSGNHYIVMEYLEGPSLKACLAQIPEVNVSVLIEQLVSACEFLELNKLAHRDIKPANIVVLEDLSRLVLLDFGVLKPVGEVGLTDIDGQRLFVGTLQYSSPEFLLRREEDNEEGWRALSIYQVGAVLHDMIMRRPIFEEFVNPYAALVNAVQFEQPTVASETTPPYLVDACRMALVKDASKRLSLVDWNTFRPPIASSVADAARQRISKRLLLADALAEGAVDRSPAIAELLETVIEGLKVELRRIRQANSTIMPPLEITREPKRTPKIIVRMNASADFKLAAELRIEIFASVVDVDSQAVQLDAQVACSAGGSDSAQHTIIYRGPYSSSAIGEKLETALIVALDLAQNGQHNYLSLSDMGVG